MIAEAQKWNPPPSGRDCSQQDAERWFVRRPRLARFSKSSARAELAADIDSLGRVLLQFIEVNLLTAKPEGKQPEWLLAA